MRSAARETAVQEPEPATKSRAGNGKSPSQNGSPKVEMVPVRHTAKPDIGLSGHARGEVIRILVHALADTTVLYTKTRNFHWNVTGPTFTPLHELFEKQYDSLAQAADRIAERIRMLGGVAPGSSVEFLGAARLSENPGELIPADEMVSRLLADHEAVARQLRKDVDSCEQEHGDAGTTDFLTGLLLKHESAAWILRSTLDRKLPVESAPPRVS